MAENKTKPTLASVDEFIAKIENTRRRKDALVALNMCAEITGESPLMWGPSIIGFGSRHYAYESGREGTAPVVCFSPRKANMTFYVGNKFIGAKGLYAKLGKHRKSVSCLYINKLDNVDMAVLREIVARQMAHNSKNLPLR
ncbi:MAG: DUF1801 domain-containing protein [Granulosicoccaceae bacterium]